MINPTIRYSTLYILLVISWFNGAAANAGTEALISLHGGSQMTWEQRLTLQESLRKVFDFAETRFLVDATADEVAPIVKQFLEKPSENSDRRLVWVSGLDSRTPSSVCPDSNLKPIRPVAASLILAPTCLARWLILPQGTRHFAITQPSLSTHEARLGRITERDAPWIAYLTLPSDHPRFVRTADALIIDKLLNQAQGTIDAGELLYRLRMEFQSKGSEFTPTLDLFDPGVSEMSIYPFVFKLKLVYERPRALGQKVFSTLNPINIYDRPTPNGLPVLTVKNPKSIRFLREGADSRMKFVVLSNNVFGWVRSTELKF